MAAVAFVGITELMYREAENTASPNATPTPQPLAQELTQYRSAIDERIVAIMNNPHIDGRTSNVQSSGKAEVISARTTDPKRPFGAYRLEWHPAHNHSQAVTVGVTEYAGAGSARFTDSDIVRGIFILGQPDGSLTMAAMEKGTTGGITYIYGTMINSAEPSSMRVSRQPRDTPKASTSRVRAKPLSRSPHRAGAMYDCSTRTYRGKCKSLYVIQLTCRSMNMR